MPFRAFIVQSNFHNAYALLAFAAAPRFLHMPVNDPESVFIAVQQQRLSVLLYSYAVSFCR